MSLYPLFDAQDTFQYSLYQSEILGLVIFGALCVESNECANLIGFKIIMKNGTTMRITLNVALM